MSDLKLFRLAGGVAVELPGTSAALEKSVQNLIESNLPTLFGVRFLASEYSTGSVHGGRIDSLGLDENNGPVIFEYKRTVDENVINQGLFYLDWLLDHRAEFAALVRTQLGDDVSAELDWTNPRVVCVASNFTRYDEHAVRQIGRSIELVRYRLHESEFLTLEQVVAVNGSGPTFTSTSTGAPSSGGGGQPTFAKLFAGADEALTSLFDEVDRVLQAMGDDVVRTDRKHYVAYRRLKNFACVEVHPMKGQLLVYVKVNPDHVVLREGFTRDVRSIGHFGTGDLEIRISNIDELRESIPLLESSYQAS